MVLSFLCFASFLLFFLCFFGPRPLILSSLLLSCCWSSSLEVCAAASSSFCFFFSCFSSFVFQDVVVGRVLGKVFLFSFALTFSFSFLSFHLHPSAFLGEANLLSFYVFAFLSVPTTLFQIVVVPKTVDAVPLPLVVVPVVGEDCVEVPVRFLIKLRRSSHELFLVRRSFSFDLWILVAAAGLFLLFCLSFFSSCASCLASCFSS